MSETLKAVILGIVQGLSEFLPISSSGHLVLFSEILDFNGSGLAFEVFVHFGTLLAVLVVFRKDIIQMLRYLPGVFGLLKNGMVMRSKEDEYRAMSLYVIIGTIPVVLIGLSLKDAVAQLFDSPVLVLISLFITGIVMWSSRYPIENRHFMGTTQAILIGFAQAFAIIPGISRSGSTIVTALWLGVNRETAARFSFLLSIPVILGATILQFKDLLDSPPSSDEINNLVIGTVAAAISGYFAIIWLLELIRKQKLEWFGVYCAAVSIIGLVVFAVQ